MSTRRGSIQGVLERIEIRLMADFGENLNLETIFFISDEWTGPTVSDFSTLSQMRMALDPFYPNPAAEPGRIFLVVSSVINWASVGKDNTYSISGMSFTTSQNRYSCTLVSLECKMKFCTITND